MMITSTITVACQMTTVTDGPGAWVTIGCTVHGADAAHAAMQHGQAGIRISWANHVRMTERAVRMARKSAERLASPVSPTCTADSGAATDCQPICSRPTRFRVAYDVSCYGTFVADVCAEHLGYTRGRVYPSQCTVTDVRTGATV